MTTQQRTPHPVLPHRRAPLLPASRPSMAGGANAPPFHAQLERPCTGTTSASPAMRLLGLAAGLTGQQHPHDAARAACWRDAMADHPEPITHYADRRGS